MWVGRIRLGSATSPRWTWCAVVDVPPQGEESGGYLPRAWSGHRWGDALDFDALGVMEAFERWQAAEIARLRTLLEAARSVVELRASGPGQRAAMHEAITRLEAAVHACTVQS